MTGNAAAPLLDLVLYPNPPMGRSGHTMILVLSVAVGGLLALGFASVGAWPVSAFFGLDLIALYLALRWTSRQARRFEMIRLEPGALVVRRVEPSGRAFEERFDPYWVKVVFDEPARGLARLALASHGRAVPIGAFLTCAEKRDLASHLQAALTGLKTPN